MAVVPVSKAGKVPTSDALFQRISHFCNLAEEERVTLERPGEREEDGEGPAPWVQSSMERVEHFLQGQKLRNFISHPVQLGEYAKTLIAEETLMSSKVKEVAAQLKSQCEGESGESREGGGDPRRRILGGAMKGDSFFADESQEGCSGKSVPSVLDLLGDEFKSERSPKKKTQQGRGTRGKQSVERHSKGASTTRKKADDDDFPCAELREFIRYGVTPQRSHDRRRQMQNDAWEAYLSERENQQLLDRQDRKSGLVDKSREFVVEITVYRRSSTTEPCGLDKVTNPASGLYKIEILGSQPLTTLRDALMCENDWIFLREAQNIGEPIDDSWTVRRQLKSAMLFIDNTIYNENRWSGCFDYASQIIRWSQQNPKKQVGPFKRGDMSCANVEDLTVQFGHPYLYRHIGDCEHIIVFNSARLLSFDDEHRQEYFPRTSWIADVKPILCKIDNQFIAAWAVLDHPELPENPMLLCSDCVQSFCYKENNQKRCSFRLYPFRQLICEIPLPCESIQNVLRL